MLRKRILQTLEKIDNVDQRTLSRISGVNDSSISRYLHGYKNISFSAVLKIVKKLYPDQEREVMAEYAVTQRSRNARLGLEYCEINNLPEESKQLIDILKSSVNPVDKEWASLYQFIRHLKDQTLPLKELQDEVEVFKPKELEIKIMKRLVKTYISLTINDHHSVIMHTTDLDKIAKETKSDFLRDCYNICLGLIMNHIALYANDLEGARYYNSLVINQKVFENVKGLAYHHLGNSFIFGNYDKTKYYIERAMKYYKETENIINYRKAKFDLSFAQSYWKVEREINQNVCNDVLVRIVSRFLK